MRNALAGDAGAAERYCGKNPLKRWAPETLTYLKNNGFKLNPDATLAENIALNHGTLGVAPPPHTATPGMTLNSPAGTPSGQGGIGSDARFPLAAPAVASSGILPGFGTADASNTFLKGADQFAKGAAGQDGSSQQAPRAPPMPQLQPQPPHMPQIFGQTLNSPPPLQWGPATPGSNGAGTPIAPASPTGTSLQQLQMMLQQMGYGGMGNG